MPKPVVTAALTSPARVAIAAVAAFAAFAAFTATPAHANADWLCSLSGDGLRLVCVADDDPRAEAAAPASPTPPTAVVRGTRFPLDRRQVHVVDLFSPPDDEAWVGLLARSTICHRSPGCSVTLAPSAWLTTRAPRFGGRFCALQHDSCDNASHRHVADRHEAPHSPMLDR